MKTLEEEIIIFVYLVTQRFQNQPSKFDEFAKTLRDLITSIIVQKQQEVSIHLISKLKNIFANHQDLLMGLNFFLEYQPPIIIQDNNVEKISIQHHDVEENDSIRHGDIKNDSSQHHAIKENDSIQHHNIKKRRKHDNLKKNRPKKLQEGKIFDLACDFLNKIYDRCVEKDDFSMLTSFFQVMVSYKEKKIDAYKVSSEFKKLFNKDPDLFVESTQFLADSFDSKESLDYSDVKFLKGREDDHSHSVAKEWSLYEATQLVHEFYMYEMDMVINRIRSTRKRMKTNPEKLKECLTILDRKCIEQLYYGPEQDCKGAGKEMVTKLLENEVNTYKVVLERLKQKKKQLKELREQSKQIWKEILEDVRQDRKVRHSELLERAKKESRLFVE